MRAQPQGMPVGILFRIHQQDSHVVHRLPRQRKLQQDILAPRTRTDGNYGCLRHKYLIMMDRHGANG